ncbi:MAG: Ldh family oxidoreductase [Bacteroidales bacterium]|jgi:LDH2 family malate/lactate/ureidoglycolate dehydrogenase|nr:Ldh family oxidoreductase [Bacteroidales bacterium]
MYSYQYLFNFTQAVLQKMGFSEQDAGACAKVFLAAEMRGISTHGIIRLSDYFKLWEAGRINVKPDIRTVHESPCTAVIDGDGTIGMLPAIRGMQTAIAKAATAGTGWVAVRNSSNFGIAGYYAMMALEHDMIGFASTNASPLVAPTFSAVPMLGTNPIAIAVPAGKQPAFVADFATTPITRGKFTVAAKKGEKIGFGYAQDAEGNPTDDPTSIEHGGSMLPLGGDREHGSHKGYCLAAVVDILSAVLSGANFGPFVPPMMSYLPLLEQKSGEGWGHFFGAMRVDAFTSVDEFKARMDKWIDVMRHATPAKGQEKVLIPGDPERENEERMAKEGITLLPQVEKDMKAMAEKLGITHHHCQG